MKMGARSWLPSSSLPYHVHQQHQQQEASSPSNSLASGRHERRATPASTQSSTVSLVSSPSDATVAAAAAAAAAATGTRSSSPSTSSASSTPPSSPSPTGTARKQHRHHIVAPISRSIDCHPLFPIPGAGGAGVQLVGSSGGLEKRPDGGAAVALAAATAAQQAERHLAVRRDLALNLPPCPALPDGEERPYGASTRLRIRDYDQESEIIRECIRPPPNRTVQPSTMGVLGGSPTPRVVVPPSAVTATATSLLCCSAPGCCGSTSSVSSAASSAGGYRNHHLNQRSHHVNNHVNYLRSRRKPSSHHNANQQSQQQQQHEVALDKHPDGPLSARLEAPPAAPLSVMVPSSGKSFVKCVKSLRDRVNTAESSTSANQNHQTKSLGDASTQHGRPCNNNVAPPDATASSASDGWPINEANSRSKLASLTVVSCSSASSPIDGGSPASSGRASPAKPAEAHT